jgi:rod shape-determining protein MreD
MISILLAVPILGGLTILQSAVLGRMPLVHGTADLTFLAITAWALRPRVRTHWQWSIIGGLFASLMTALPFGIMLASYLVSTALAIYFRQRVWKVPVLTMFTVVFLGTLITHGLSIIAIGLTGTLLPLVEVLNTVTLPSLLLNVLLAIPIYLIIGDIANRLYPEEIET